MHNLKQFCNAFETRERNNGDKFICLADNSPDWMKDIIRDAHCDMFPDDIRYRMIQECADSLTEYDPSDWEDSAFEICDGLVDVYNLDRLNWLSSHLTRAFYIDNARNEGLISDDTDEFDRIGIGQFCEYQEIIYSLICSFK